MSARSPRPRSTEIEYWRAIYKNASSAARIGQGADNDQVAQGKASLRRQAAARGEKRSKDQSCAVPVRLARLSKPPNQSTRKMRGGSSWQPYSR
eukprot:6198310-Pleurochrysis_carterae.AAC.2